MRMAGVFIISTATIALRTQFMPRWLAVLGYILAIVLLLSSGLLPYVELLFPIWVFLVSVYTLLVVERSPESSSGNAAPLPTG
jgi:hypothetical protein